MKGKSWCSKTYRKCVCDRVSSPDRLAYLWVRTSCDSSALSSVYSVHIHTPVSSLLEIDQLLPSFLTALVTNYSAKYLLIILHNRKCVTSMPKKSGFFSTFLLDGTKIYASLFMPRKKKRVIATFSQFWLFEKKNLNCKIYTQNYEMWTHNSENKNPNGDI